MNRYIPSARECPLYLQLPDGELSKTNAFISPVSTMHLSCAVQLTIFLDSVILLCRCGEVLLFGTHQAVHLVQRRRMGLGDKCHHRCVEFIIFCLCLLICLQVHCTLKHWCATGTYGDSGNLHWAAKTVIWSKTELSCTWHGCGN